MDGNADELTGDFFFFSKLGGKCKSVSTNRKLEGFRGATLKRCCFTCVSVEMFRSQQTSFSELVPVGEDVSERGRKVGKRAA